MMASTSDAADFTQASTSQQSRWLLKRQAMIEYPSRVRNAASGLVNHVLYGKWRQRPEQFLRSRSSDRVGTGKNSMIWLLGRPYLFEEHDRSAEIDFTADFRSRIWLTYRQDFPPLLNSQKVSDCGWGCMLRCGQMMIAHALVLRDLGRDWRLGATSTNTAVEPIIRLFEDCEKAPLSIHNLMRIAAQQRANTWNDRSETAEMKTNNGELILPISRKPKDPTIVGQWFSPSETMTLMRDLIHTSTGVPSLKLYSSKDMNVIIEDLVKLSENWTNAVILIVSTYYNQLKSLFAIEQCCGVIGGRPKRAYYFIGCENDRIYYLDPHTVQKYQPLDGVISESEDETHSSSPDPIVNQELMDECLLETGVDLTADMSLNSRGQVSETEKERKNRKWATFHCTKTPSLSLEDVDPSCAIGFLFRNQRDLDQCLEDLILANVIDYKDSSDSPQNLSAAPTPIFTIYENEQCFTASNYAPAALSRSWDAAEPRTSGAAKLNKDRKCPKIGLAKKGRKFNEPPWGDSFPSPPDNLRLTGGALLVAVS